MAHFRFVRVSIGAIAIGVVCVTVFAGCDSGPTMHNVSGKVFYTDGTVPNAPVAVVRFQPSPNTKAEIRKGASGAIQSDGSFELWTRQEGDGVYEGEYTVTFAVLKAPTNPTPLITPKYTAPALTPYTVMVDQDLEDLKFEIEPLPGVSGAPPSG